MDQNKLTTVLNGYQNIATNQAATLNIQQGQNPILQTNIPHQEKKPEVPLKQSKFLDFLSSSGKIATIALSATPLPTYIGCWGKTKQE